MKAVWNGKIIAESDATVVVENNHYFPLDSVNQQYLTNSDRTSFCPWKGSASYYNINVDDETNESAAWHYPEPKDAAKEIRGRVAFWNGVQVTGQEGPISASPVHSNAPDANRRAPAIQY